MATKKAAAASPPAFIPGTSIEAPGMARVFPKLKTYLKAYFQLFTDWQEKHLPLLQQYARGEAESTPTIDDPQVTLAYRKACWSLYACALALDWHAVQTALGGGLPPGKSKAPDAKATRLLFGKLVEGGKHVHMQSPPAVVMRYFYQPEEPDFDANMAATLDKEVSEAEFKIVRHLLLEGHARAAVEESFLACAPRLGERKGANAAAYVAETLKRAEEDPDLRKWRAQHAADAAGAGDYQGSIGGDWMVPWRRAVAYHYWSCRMAAHGGRSSYWIYDLVRTATCCLLLGWEDWALTLFRQILDGIAAGRFSDCDKKKKPFFERRTQFFLLRLVADWQGMTLPALPPQASDDALLNAVLAHWRDAEPAALATFLLAVCDRHTHLVGKSKNGPEFNTDRSVTYFPFEVLAVFYVRRALKLANPALAHPLMATPLAALPAPTPPYTEALLEAVIAQARKEYAALT